MMAGVTLQGFVTKRQGELITDMREEAKIIFQDLVTPGDEVDTGDTSTIGRFIGLTTPSLDDLWQAALEVYQAFDINSATGKALDNLTALGGIIRLTAEPTRADVYLRGLIGTTVQEGFSARSSITNQLFILTDSVVFSTKNTMGVTVGVKALTSTNSYGVSIIKSASQVKQDIVVPSVVGETSQMVLESLRNSINSNIPGLFAEIEDESLKITPRQDFDFYDFAVTDNLVITESYKSSVVESDGASDISEPPNAINIIATPTYGWTSINNPLSGRAGRFIETDEELRQRFKDSRFERSTNIIESLYSALYSLQGISNVFIYENDTDVVDNIGLPPHSFLVLVDGANPTDIARAIWENRPTGILSVGNTSVDIIDSFGYVRNIKFSRPEEVGIYIQLRLQTNERFPSDGEEKIKQALIDYINSLNMGEDVIYSRLYTPINSVPGHQVNELLIGTSPAVLHAGNIEINYDQSAKTATNRITFLV